MKKTLKILAILLIAMSLLFVTVQPTQAKADPGDVISNSEDKGSEVDDEGMSEFAGTLINYIWWISIIVAVVVLMVLGIRYMVGGVQDKSNYKQSMTPVVIGIIIIVFATTITKFLFSLNSSSSSSDNDTTTSQQGNP